MFLARAAIGGCIALTVLSLQKRPLLPRAHRKNFVLVALGIIFAFPFFIALALRHVQASHAAVVTGILPLATAIAGAVLLRERHGLLFWLSALAGSATVSVFVLRSNAGSIGMNDLLLLFSVIAAAVGYAEGGRLARVYGGPMVISWCLIGSLPVVALPLILTFRAEYLAAPITAWGGLFYTGIFSVYLGFFAWYRGLSEGGVGRVGQVQLLQPFLTLLFSSAFFAERIEAAMFGTALLVAAFIFIGRLPLSAVSLRDRKEKP